MERIKEIKRLTDNRFVNLYEQTVEYRDGHQGSYYVASRRNCVEELKSTARRKIR